MLTQFVQQLANGVVLGAMYALIALGYTMVYGIIQLINFAHGEIFMIGAFGAFTVYRYILPDGTSLWIALPLMLLGGMIAAVAVAVAMERFAYRPLRNAPRLAPLITAIGVSIALQEAVRLYYPDARSKLAFPQLITGSPIPIGFGASVDRASVVVVLVSVICMVALTLFVRRSRMGRAMQATAQDPDTARLMGINIDRVIVMSFLLGAALAAVAGMAQGLYLGQIDFRMGFIAGLKAFTAAVLGGIGNIQGAVVGGFALGIVEVMAVQYIPGQFGGGAWKDVWAFALLILVLVFRPQGLLGERVADRA
ncbi:branched-chain amino acid ABC transporter permease [Sphaerimonospora thailandensis]|uniref:Branched-chain amino acid ABC transporter permease n=1 Tax=Sphaerimonospora thailandensis TaxID=795644 RepID=A0A8J3W0X5_9ACTN|nr:branched-chain amino acid ABC transporter permease [Sphaerimonospora thailandensis]GIH72092.1 branched-chain amino acid ABC transporter permease [Sphaerimonospora thailandensis]